MYATNREVKEQSASGVAKGKAGRRTFILPFIAATFLALPSLLVVAYSKQTAGFDLLIVSGSYYLILAALWVAVPVALVSALLHILRSNNTSSKAAVSILSVVVLSSFIYILWQ